MTYLSHPFIFDFGNLGVGVAHHGNQQVHQQDVGNGQKDKTAQLVREGENLMDQYNVR